MSQVNRTLYLPYGAYELKATYQRNLGVAMLTVCTFVITLLALGWALSGSGDLKRSDQPPPDRTAIEIIIPPPLNIERPAPQIEPTAPATPARPAEPIDVTVPAGINIVDDDPFAEEPVRLASRDERRDLVQGVPGGSGTPTSTGRAITGSFVGQGDLPGITEFRHVEEEPELIHRVKPEYPRYAKMRGDEGTVIIKALVGKEGDVLEAVVFGSSGHVSLDDAALAVAGLYKYRPAIQNRRPIAVWVTYNVEFRLE